MNGCERIQAAIARRPVDRIPFGFYAVDPAIVSRVIGRPTVVRNWVEFQIAQWQGRVDAFAEQYGRDLIDFYNQIACADIITCRDAWLMPPSGFVDPNPACEIAPNHWQDSLGREWLVAPEANEIKLIVDPSACNDFTVTDFEKPLTAEECAAPDASVFTVFDRTLAAFGKERYLASASAGITCVTLLGDFDQAMMRFALEPEVIHACNRRQVLRQNKLDAYYLRPETPGAVIDQDFSGTLAPYISPAMFRDMALPYLKERVNNIKQTGHQVIMHSCGCSRPVMDQLIMAGIDAYQSLQTNAAGMEIAALQEAFGDRLCFWGGIPVEILIDGSMEDTRRIIRDVVARTKPLEGGIILGPSQSIMQSTNYDNFMAMVDEIQSLRQ
jgi:uroporphyrinogen decarboxylase